MKQLIIILGIVGLLGIGGGTFYFINKNSVSTVVPETNQNTENAAVKPLTQLETITARAFANKILGLIQSKDYGKVWDLFTPENQKAITRGDYIKQLVDAIGDLNISSYEVKDVIEEKDGASFQYVLRYSNNPGNPEETGIFNLTKRNGKWFFLNNAESQVVIEKHIGDEIQLATLKFKVNSVSEPDTLPESYGDTKATPENSKFILVNMTITNTTPNEVDSPFSDSFGLSDNQGRNFTVYNEFSAVSDDKNYLTYRKLKPGIPETGYIVYEVPLDANSYSILIGKSGTNDVYKVILK